MTATFTPHSGGRCSVTCTRMSGDVICSFNIAVQATVRALRGAIAASTQMEHFTAVLPDATLLHEWDPNTLLQDMILSDEVSELPGL